MSLLGRASVRFLRRHPAEGILTVVGVALGVTVVLGMDLANASARRAFRFATDSVTGAATHRIVGGPGGVPNETYAALRRAFPEIAASPVVEGWVDRPAGGGFQLLGVDPLADPSLRPALGLGQPGALALGPLLTRPGAALGSAPTMERLGLGVDDTFPVRVGETETPMTLVGLIRPADERTRAGIEDLLVVDVATAQEILGRLDAVDRIDLRIEEPGVEDRLREALPPGLRVLGSPNGRTADQMTRAFRWNLNALSLLALLCGAFLIYNTVLFSIVQRRRTFGILRTLGISRRRLLRFVLGEAALLGVAGTLLGLAGGVLLAQQLLALVTRTLSDLYFRVEVRHVAVGSLELAKAVGLGLGATLVSAVAPAIEAARSRPGTVLLRSRLEERAARFAPRAALAGALVAAIGAVLMALPGRGILLAFFALFALLVGCTLAMPWLTALVCRVLGPVFGRLFGIQGRLAVRGVEAGLSRTGVAVAALALAISVAVGVSAMIGSFRQAVEAWLRGSLDADVYVSVPHREPGPPRIPLPPGLPERVTALPDLDAATLLRAVRLETTAGPLDVIASRPAPGRDETPALLEGDPAAAREAWRDGRAVLVSEPLAAARGLSVGDSITLPTDRGPLALPIAGIYRDYGSDRGVVSLHLDAFRRLWDDRELTALGLFAAPGTEPAALAEGVRDTLAPGESVRVQTTRDLLEGSLRVFDRTFAVTSVLRLLAIAVAFVGVLAALMALSLERERELAILRATGLTPGGLRALVTLQTLVMGAIAGLLALPLGILLAAVMVHVVNRRSFGWSMALRLEPSLALLSLGLGVLAAFLAGLYPAWRMSRTAPAVALREE